MVCVRRVVICVSIPRESYLNVGDWRFNGSTSFEPLLASA